MSLKIYIAVALLMSSACARPLKKSSSIKQYEPNEFELEQNQNAKYEFSSNVEDGINDLTQQRSEKRDGLNVKGFYSYTDGHYKITVFYEADDQGYRVIKTDKVKLNDGPKVDLNGSASVSSNAHGKVTSYRVQSVPVPGPVGKIID